MPAPYPLKVLRTGVRAPYVVRAETLTPLVHVHVPKCAGTTLDEILLGAADALGRPSGRFHGTIYGQGFSGPDKAEAWREAEGFEYPHDWLYASGHIPYGRFPAHGARVNEVCIIRDPLPRLISMFRMGAKRGVWQETTPVATLFRDGLLSANGMVRQLSGETSPDAPLDSGHLAAALRNFEKVRYRGRIEDFDRILAAILRDFHIPYVAYHRFQVSKDPALDTHGRFAAELAPYVELDQAFFDQAIQRCPKFRAPAEITLGDIEPGAPVLLVSALLRSRDDEDRRSVCAPVEAIVRLIDG